MGKVNETQYLVDRFNSSTNKKNKEMRYLFVFDCCFSLKRCFLFYNRIVFNVFIDWWIVISCILHCCNSVQWSKAKENNANATWFDADVVIVNLLFFLLGKQKNQWRNSFHSFQSIDWNGIFVIVAEEAKRGIKQREKGRRGKSLLTIIPRQLEFHWKYSI